MGKIVATPGALLTLDRTGELASKFLSRHSRGDWGTVNEEDWKANDDALIQGTRLLSAYKLNDDTVIWIITESDRSVTTLLLAEEY
jgi:hypothetical protein